MGTATFDNTISGSGTILECGFGYSNTLVVTGNNSSYTGTITLHGYYTTLQVGNGGTAGSLGSATITTDYGNGVLSLTIATL